MYLPEKVAHRACLSVKLDRSPHRPIVAHFVVHLPLCLYVLFRVVGPLHIIGGGGESTSNRFFHMQHTDFENLVHFSLMTDTFTQASGRMWDRHGAIPMGGPFSAQAADLE